MVEIKWIKLDTAIFDDEKIKIIMAMPEGKTILIVWLRLLCLAGRLNSGGVLMINNTIPYTEEMLGAVFGESPQIMRLAIDTFHGLGMIDKCNGALYLPNWEKHQSEDALAKIRESNRLSQAKYRERQKLAAGDAPVILRSSDSNGDGNPYVTIQRVENRELENRELEKKTSTKRKRVHPLFDTFWQAYPKRIAKAKAEEAFSKLNPDEELMKVMLAAVQAWSKTDQWTKESGQFVPNPTTWINQRRWEDELPKDNKPKERKIEMMN